MDTSASPAVVRKPPDLSVLKLDRGRYYATVHGEHGADATRFRQDGLPYSAEGNLVVEALSPAEKKAAEEMAAEIKVEEIDGEKVIVGGDVNLELWLRGQADYPAGKVFKTIRELHKRNVSNFADAVEFLVEDPKGPKIIPYPLVHKKRLSAA